MLRPFFYSNSGTNPRWRIGDKELVAAGPGFPFVRTIRGLISQLSGASRAGKVQGLDFSRWANDVLGDHQLAQGLQELDRVTATGAPPDRSEILAYIQSQYPIAEGSRSGVIADTSPKR